MPSERYIRPSTEQIRKWEEEKQAAQRFTALRSELIEAALRRLKKDELIELLMGLDVYDPSVRWSIEANVGVKKPADLIAYDLHEAIKIATKVDKSKLNRNFDYSWQAYEECKRGFTALILSGELETAREIAIEFMRKASYQVECSDEGLMTEEIETCLKPVIEAVAATELEARRTWAHEMLRADSFGFICRKALDALI